MRKLTTVIAGLAIAAAGFAGGYAATAASSPAVCHFDGGGTITAGNAARTTEGTTWVCGEDGTLTELTAHTVPSLPSWVHWRQAGGYMRDLTDCGKDHAAVIVWGGHGDTSALVCRSGIAEAS